MLVELDDILGIISRREEESENLIAEANQSIELARQELADINLFDFSGRRLKEHAINALKDRWNDARSRANELYWLRLNLKEVYEELENEL